MNAPPADSDERFKATVEHATLERAFKAVEPIAAEARIEITDSTFSVAVTDPANVLATGAENQPIDAPGDATFAVGTADMLVALRRLNADTDGPLTLEVSGDDSNLLLIDGMGMEEIDLFDPASLRESADMSKYVDHEYGVEATAPAWELAGALGKLAPPADEAVRVFPTNEGIWVEGFDSDGESPWPYSDQITAEYDKRPPVYDAAITMLSDDVAQDFADALPTDGELDVYFGHEMPLVAVAESGVTVAAAPRLEDPSEGGDGA